MKRRELLASMGLAAIAGCASDVGDGGNTGSGKQFGFGSPGFDRIEWINLNVLRIYFESDHDMQGFGLFHSHDQPENFDSAFILCKAPRFEGPIDFPLIDRIRSSSTVFPNREFMLVAYEGSFSECDSAASLNIIQDILGDVTFTVPASIAPRPNFADLETFTRTTLPVYTDE